MAYKAPRKGWIKDGVGYIPLTKGTVAKVDPELVAELEQHNWYAAEGGGSKSTIYAFRRAKGTQGRVIMHRYVLSADDRTLVVDHINHDALDNRKSNLRIATVAQNGQNSRRAVNNKTGFKGVSWDRTNQKYLAKIRNNGKQIHIGRCSTPEEAYALYCETAARLHGEFACIK